MSRGFGPPMSGALIVIAYLSFLLASHPAFGGPSQEAVRQGHELMLAGRYPEALVELNRAIRLEPRSDVAYGERAECLYRMGKTREALQDNTRAIQLQPRALYYSNRGLCHRRLRQRSAALTDFSEAIRRDPAYAAKADLYAYRGTCLAGLHRDTEAVADYSRSLALRPDDPFTWANRGCSYVAMGQPARAIQDMSRAIEMRPLEAGFYVTRADAFDLAGTFERAVEDCTRAISLDARISSAYVNRAYARCGLGQFDLALADVRQALQLNPRSADAWGTRGRVLLLQKRYQEAIEALNRAIALQAVEGRRDVMYFWSSHGAEHRLDRGRAFQALGQPAKAQADFEAARRIGPRGTKPGPRH